MRASRVTAPENAFRRGNATRKDKHMADLVVFLTALGMAIVAWLIQRALFRKMKQRGARFDEQEGA